MQSSNQQPELIPDAVEAVLRDTILPDLDRGRKNFDRPHTEAVVFWMKELLGQIDPVSSYSATELITAAYAHDWGYIGLFDGVNSDDPQVIASRKPLHMERGAEMIHKLLTEKLSQFFSSESIERVAHLVAVHDKVEELSSAAELLIMEADTLGMLDVSKVKPTFSAKNNVTFMEKEIYGRRLPKFMHRDAKINAQKLAQARATFFTK